MISGNILSVISGIVSDNSAIAIGKSSFPTENYLITIQEPIRTRKMQSRRKITQNY